MHTSFEPGARGPEGFIPLAVPEIRGNEWKYAKECLDTGWVSSAGPFVDRFEKAIGDYVGAKHAVSVVNGTCAIHLALIVAGIKPDDEVLVPSLTFIAPANAVRYAGAWPVFIDAEPNYWQIDPAKVRDFLEKECVWKEGALRNRKTGRRVSAILPVHILGHPTDVDPILQIARKYDLVVIEDATESLGSKYKGRMVGTLGDITCFSFNGNKIITTGGGGILVTDNEKWATHAKYLTTQAKDDPVEYVHNEVGYNYRLTNIQAAIGCAQLEQLDDYIAAKRQTANGYREELKNVPGIALMREAEWASSIFWLMTVFVDPSRFGIDSRNLLTVLSKNGVQARPLWQPLHLSKAHAGSISPDCPVAEDLNEHCLSLPSSVGLKTEERKRVTSLIRDCRRFSKSER
jgi:perosamine synthetase